MNTATVTKRRATIDTKRVVVRATEKRLLVWERARGMWKGHTPDPIQELALMRNEMDRSMHATSHPK